MQTQNSEDKKAGVVGAVGALGALALKSKAALLSAFKVGWLLKATWTMLLSFGLYATMFGWQWAAIMIGLILIHEMGHWVFMKVKGLQPKMPVFIPFMGAYVAMTKLPEDPVIHAWVAISGPLAGGLAAAVLYAIGSGQDNKLMLSAASWGFILNLLQLVPVRPFDGGFVAECISKWLAIPGLILLFVVAAEWQSPLLFVISAVSVFATIKRFRTAPTASVSLPQSEVLQITVLYFGLAWALANCYFHTEARLKALLGH